MSSHIVRQTGWARRQGNQGPGKSPQPMGRGGRAPPNLPPIYLERIQREMQALLQGMVQAFQALEAGRPLQGLALPWVSGADTVERLGFCAHDLCDEGRLDMPRVIWCAGGTRTRRHNNARVCWGSWALRRTRVRDHPVVPSLPGHALIYIYIYMYIHIYIYSHI
jgi:hypothetical protein